MKKRIMLVEDESIIRLDLAMILKEAGYDIVGEAGDGEKAIELAYTLKPDLIIMDIKMPKMDGLKASKIINEKLKVPILLLTAYSQQEYIEKAKKVNIIGYVVKPFSEASLIPAVEIALNQAENRIQYEQQIHEANQNIQKRKVVEKAKGLLMEKFNLTEDVAYKKMKKISMNNQTTLEKVAKRILVKYNS